MGAAIVWPKIGSNDAPREQGGYWLGSIKRENCRMSERLWASVAITCG